MTRARILVVDDHDVVRRGLRAILEARPDWEVCAEATTGREAIEKARQEKPDIIVMDITMPELNGLEATRQIVRTVPGTRVLILTMHESEQIVREVLDAGARGYVLKSDAGHDLPEAVEALLDQRPFFTPRVSEIVLEGYLKKGVPEARAPGGRLTPREREVAQLLAEGASNKEVGRRLGISVKTVETHRANIMRKLNLNSLSALVRYAVRNQMIQP